jgi:hypothetical protein
MHSTAQVDRALTEEARNGIQPAEMRFLRSPLGVTIQDRLTNEVIRKTKVKSPNDTINKYRDN